MARIEIDPNYSSPTFSRATAAADIFKKEDVQALAAAMSTHTHDGAGRGLAITPPANSINGGLLMDGTVTSAKILDGTITSADIADGTIQGIDIADGAITTNKIATGAVGTLQIQDGTIQTVDIGDLVVTQIKLAANSVTTPHLANGATTNPTTTSATFVDIPEMTTTFTTTAASAGLYIHFQSPFYMSAAAADLSIQIVVDGAASANTIVRSAGINQYFPVSLFAVVGVVSGAHTVKVQWNISAGTATAHYVFRYLGVQEVYK